MKKYALICVLLLATLSLGVRAAIAYQTYLPIVYNAPPPTQTPTALPPTPTPTLTPTPTVTPIPILPIGTTVDFDNFRGTITEAYRVDHFEGDSGPIYPIQVFVVAIVDVENLSFASDSVSRYDLRVRDSIGRLFDMAELEAQWAAEDQYGRTGVYEDIQPNFIENQVYAFDVALDSHGLELVADSPPITPTPNPLPISIVNIGIPGSSDNWKYTVTNVITTNTLNGDYDVITAKGEFLVIFASVQNLGLEARSISRYDFVIQDSLTRQYDMAELEAQWAAEDQYGRTGVYEVIQPSFTIDQVYVFDILPSASGLYFLPTDPGDAVDLNQ
jgi:hypothetical protein